MDGSNNPVKVEQIMKSVNDMGEKGSKDLVNAAKTLSEEGKMFAAGKYLSNAADLKSRIKNNESQNDAAILFEEAASHYYSANYYVEAARNIEKAAKIHIELKQYEFAIDCYALAKNYYGDAGDYSKCGEAYANEMKHKENLYKSDIKNSDSNKDKTINLLNYLKYLSFRKTMGYGESLKALMITTIIIILLFTLIYYALQIVVLPDSNKGNLFYVEPSYSINYLFVCFKFSLSLFSGYSTTPYQLYEFNLISTIEVLFGNLFLALFISIIIRKISRR